MRLKLQIAVIVVGLSTMLASIAGAIAAMSPDPPPGVTKPAKVVPTQFVCAFDMDHVGNQDGHELWAVGKKRWCKWVVRR